MSRLLLAERAVFVCQAEYPAATLAFQTVPRLLPKRAAILIKAILVVSGAALSLVPRLVAAQASVTVILILLVRLGLPIKTAILFLVHAWKQTEVLRTEKPPATKYVSAVRSGITCVITTFAVAAHAQQERMFKPAAQLRVQAAPHVQAECAVLLGRPTSAPALPA